MTNLPPIISVDDHVVECPDLWERWLPTRFTDRAPRVFRKPYEMIAANRQPFRPADSGSEADFWLFEDIWQGLSYGMSSVGLDPAQITQEGMTFDEMRLGCYDPKARLLDMDSVNVERSLCFPNAVRFCGQVFLWMKDKELALACVQAYNDWLVEEWCGDSGGRLLPVGIIPLWDPVASAAEVRRNASRGVRAVAFSELPTELALPSIHNDHWMPFFDACNETQTVICIHIGSSSSLTATSDDAPMGVRIALTTVKSQMALCDWLLSGHLVRYPELKIALSESQIGWIPFLYERVDRLWRRGNAISQISNLFEDAPSSYARHRVFGCFFEDTFGIEVARDAIGVDTITFEMDYPHQDSTWPRTYDYAAEVTASLDDRTTYMILRGNALRMLDLPEHLPSFQPSVQARLGETTLAVDAWRGV